MEKPFYYYTADAEWHRDHETDTPCTPLSTHSLLSSQGAIAYRDSGALVSIGLVVPAAHRVTGRAPNDPRPLPATQHHSNPTFHPNTHTLPTVGFHSYSGSRTAGPCSHESRCSPCTWLDLDLGGDGQASLTRVDRQLQKMRRRHQLPPLSHLHLQNVATSLPRQGRARMPQTAVHAHLSPSVPWLPGWAPRPEHPENNRDAAQRLACPCNFSSLPFSSPNISQCLFCCDRMNLLLLHCHYC